MEKDVFYLLMTITKSMVIDKKCLWSQQQNMLSIIDCIHEECKELSEAIISNHSQDQIASEAGDILSLVFVLCFIAQRDGVFPSTQPISESIAKLKRRAPYLFDTNSNITSEEAAQLWMEAKKLECEKKESLDNGCSIKDNIEA